MKSILDPSFRYTSSAKTDLRKTFARIRREGRLTQGGDNETLQCSQGTPQEARQDATGILGGGRDNTVRRLPIRDRSANS